MHKVRTTSETDREHGVQQQHRTPHTFPSLRSPSTELLRAVGAATEIFEASDAGARAGSNRLGRQG
jgi:hypothetical protein